MQDLQGSFVEEQLTLDTHDILLLLLVMLRLRLLNAQSVNVFEHARLEVHRFDLRGQEHEPCDQEALDDQTANESNNTEEEMRCKSQAARKDRDLNCQPSSLMGAGFCSRLTVSSLLPSSLPDEPTCSDVSGAGDAMMMAGCGGGREKEVLESVHIGKRGLKPT